MITALKTQQQKNQPIGLEFLKQEALLSYFQDSWELYEWLFSAIKNDETYYESPDPLRNPLVFYLGHTAAFYINKMVLAGLLKEGLNAHYEEIFAKGVDPNLPEHLEVRDLWPSISEVRAYRAAVKSVVEACIKAQDYPCNVDEKHPLWAIFMGIEHDRIHFETSSVLIRQLEPSKVERPKDWLYAPSLGNAPENKIIQCPGGTAIIGKSQNASIFGWDNEYGTLTKEVAPFEASQNLITNEEFLEFYNSGAYNDSQYWTEEGWAWKQRTKTAYPRFWVKDGDGFTYRAMFDELPMPLDYPVEVNAHEAWAYCHWKGAGWRLLSEAEFHTIAHNEIKDTDCAFDDAYNLNVKYGSPTPVGAMELAQSELGFNDLFGNVWDWLNDDFYPLPGFEIHPLYEDFSAPYFDDEHSMMLGGAWATTGTGASKYYRLWFRRHFYQHAGFRIARTLKEEKWS